MGLCTKAEASGPGCEQFHRERGSRSEPQREARKQQFLAWLSSGSPAVLRSAVHASPVVGCRYTVIHHRPRPQVFGQCAICCPQTDHGTWGGSRLLTTYRSCLVLVPATLRSSLICVPRPSFAHSSGCLGGRVNPRDVCASETGLSPHTELRRPKPGSEIFCPRGQKGTCRVCYLENHLAVRGRDPAKIASFPLGS